MRRGVNENLEVFMDIRNEIKSYIVREGVTMTEVVEKLAYEYGWSESVPNWPTRWATTSFGRSEKGTEGGESQVTNLGTCGGSYDPREW